jgi:hypothetical protein
MYRPGMPTRREFMLIADIGGYTDYMQFHRSILGHAEAATSRMLDKVVERARGFDLIGIEGDAAFLAKDVAGLSGPEVMTAVLTAVAACTAPSTPSAGWSSSTCAPAAAARRRAT